MIVLKNKWDNIKPSKKKVCAEDFEILDYNEYNELLLRNYNMDQLKKIAKKYKQKYLEINKNYVEGYIITYIIHIIL